MFVPVFFAMYRYILPRSILFRPRLEGCSGNERREPERVLAHYPLCWPGIHSRKTCRGEGGGPL